MLVFTKKNYRIEDGILLENKTLIGFSYFDLFDTYLIHLQIFDLTILSVKYSLDGVKFKLFSLPKDKTINTTGIIFTLLNIPIIEISKRKHFFRGKMVSNTNTFSSLGFNFMTHSSIFKSMVAPAVAFDSLAYIKELETKVPVAESPEMIKKKLNKYKQE